MSKQAIYLILAFLFLGLVFIVPQMVELRIKILNWLRLRGLANWHERYKAGITVAIRVMLVVLCVIMFTMAL